MLCPCSRLLCLLLCACAVVCCICCSFCPPSEVQGYPCAAQIDENDVYLIVAPQNTVGASIMEDLQAMKEAAGSKPIVLFNPILRDRPSAGGVMSGARHAPMVRGN